MLKQIQSTPGVRVAGGYLISTVIADGRAENFYGITPEVMKLKPYWKLQGGWFKGSDSVILGADVAKDTHKKVGDRIDIKSLNREFYVSGILGKTGKEDDGFYFLPMQTQQEIFNRQNKLTAIGIQLTDVSLLNEVKTELERDGAYVVPQKDIIDLVQGVVGGTKNMLLALLVIILLVAGLGVFNTVLMATFERNAEFGYLRSIGAGRRVLFELILVETLLLSAAGLVVGLGIGFASTLGLDRLFRSFLPYVPAGRIIRPDVWVLVISATVVIVLGVVAAMYPGYKASKVSPMEAIRNE
jgi:putative ABC transport system permease protein